MDTSADDCEITTSEGTKDACVDVGSMLFCNLWDGDGPNGGTMFVINDYNGAGANFVSGFGFQPSGEGFCCVIENTDPGKDRLFANGSAGDDLT